MTDATTPSTRAIADTIVSLLRDRAADASICPSEVARRLFPTGWRARMADVRAAASELRAAGVIEITQRGRPVAADARGPIRLRLHRGD